MSSQDNILMGMALCLCFSLSCNSTKRPDETSTTTKEVNTSSETPLPLAKRPNFQDEIDGKKTDLYVLKNHQGVTASITNYGGRVVNLFVKDKSGNFRDVVLGLEQLQAYITAKERYLGANVGRYGNRIAGGKFTLDDQEYVLATNNGKNHLHGGNKGFQYLVWEANQPNDSTLNLSYFSKDGEEGYPGNLTINVRYEITWDNALKVVLEASTDRKTVCNLTHHSFFNLNGVETGSSINDHQLMLHAERYTPVDETLIPTGEIAPLKGTPLDFSTPRPIGERVDAENEQIRFGNGYDHNFITRPAGDSIVGLQATVYAPESGIFLEVSSNQPGIQFYGGNFLDGSITGKYGTVYERRSAFCLEPQHYPDSPNQPNFPSTTLEPGQTYRNIIYYRFSTK